MKKILPVVVLIIIVAASAAITIIFRQRQTPQQQRAPVDQGPTPSTYKGLFPGLSTEEDTVRAIGEPIRKDTMGEITTLVYPSGINDIPVNVDLGPDNKVFRVVEPVGKNSTLNTLSAGLGKEDAVLYGLFEDQGFQLYVYLGRGVAILANPVTEEVRERWLFPPMGFIAFKQIYAPALTTSSNANQQ
jgi:hypothetical protein